MFSIDISSHWSNLSMVFFIILGLYCVWTVTKMKECELRLIHKDVSLYYYMTSFVTIFAFFAVFRLITRDVGGIDAFSYKYMFEHANMSFYQRNEWFLHNDILFRYFAKFLRLFTDDYHIYFFILYGFNTFAWLLFLKEFCLKRSNYIPCILLVFLYWVSYNTLRSSVALSVFSISLILLYREKLKWAIIIAISSILIHKSLAICVLFIPFYYIFNRVKLNRFRIILLILTIIALSSSFQLFFLNSMSDINTYDSEHYASYTRSMMGTSFWDNGWKIAFEQMILGLMMWIFQRKIKIYQLTLKQKERRKVKFIWTLCVFDMLCIPINFVLGIWRGYEFLYLARIVMWCTILYLYERKRSNYLKTMIDAFAMIALIAWIIFRFWNMWESTGLMPYVFEPLV